MSAKKFWKQNSSILLTFVVAAALLAFVSIVKPGYSQKWSKRVNLGSIDRELQPGKKYIVSVYPQTLVVPAFWANTLYQKSFEITF